MNKLLTYSDKCVLSGNKHVELLARLSAISQARVVAIEQATEKRNREKARHLEAMEEIRRKEDETKALFAATLEEAARKKIPQAVLEEVCGLSRTRMHQIRKGAK